MDVTFTPLPTVSSLKLWVKASTKNFVAAYTANPGKAWKWGCWSAIINDRPRQHHAEEIWKRRFHSLDTLRRSKPHVKLGLTLRVWTKPALHTINKSTHLSAGVWWDVNDVPPLSFQHSWKNSTDAVHHTLMTRIMPNQVNHLKKLLSSFDFKYDIPK